MKKLMILVLVVFCTPVVASAMDTEATRRAAAERYVLSMDMDKMMNDTTMQIAATLPAEAREPFIQKMKSFDTAWMSELAINAMVPVFTTEELNALADFYGSPMGRSINAKFPAYMAEFMPAMQQKMIVQAKQALQQQ